MKNMKRKVFILAMVLAAAFAMLTAAQALAMVPFSGSGTESDPFIIAGETDLRALADDVNNGEDYEGVFFKLADDIDLADPWTPIGTSYNAFNGAFDGNGKIISGLNINADYGYQGLFGHVGSGGKVERLGVAGSINITGDSDYIGGIVGRNYGTLSQCGSAVEIVVNAGEYYGDFVGGVVGDNYGTVENCLNLRAVSSSGSYVGGIIGDNDGGNVLFCYNAAPVYGKDYVGGVVGINNREGTVTSSVSLGAMVAADYGSGADVGRVIGSNNGALANNKAGADMVIEEEKGSPVRPGAIGHDEIDGADVASDTPLPVVFADWNSEVWNIPAGTFGAVSTSDGEPPMLKVLDRQSGQSAGDNELPDSLGDGFSLILPDGWERDDGLSNENSVSFKGGMLQSIRVMRHPKAELTDRVKEIYMAAHLNDHGFEHMDTVVDGNDAFVMFSWLDEKEELRYARYWIAAPEALYSVNFSIWTVTLENHPDELINGVIDSMKFGDGNWDADPLTPPSGMSDEEFLRLCQTGTAREVETAIEGGANVNAADEYGTTALMAAASSNRNPEVISILLENGADASKVDDEGMSAVGYADVNARIRNTDAYRQLTAAAARKAMSDVEFLELCVAGTEREVEAAIEGGANVNARDEHGETPLMVASRSNRNPGVVSVLLRHGADAAIRDDGGMSAVDYASVNPRLRNSDAYRELLAAADAGADEEDDAPGVSVPDSTEGALPAIQDADGTLALKLTDASSLATATSVAIRTADLLSKIFGFQEIMEALTPNLEAIEEFFSAAREMSLLVKLSDDPAFYLSLFVDEAAFDDFISKPRDFEYNLFGVGEWPDAPSEAGWTIKPADALDLDLALYVMKIRGEQNAAVFVSNTPGGIGEMVNASHPDSPGFEIERATTGDNYYQAKMKEGIKVGDLLKGLPSESEYIDVVEMLALDTERVLWTESELSWTFDGNTLDFDSYSDTFLLNPELIATKRESHGAAEIFGEGELAYFLSADLAFVLRLLFFGVDDPAESLIALLGNELSSFLSASDIRSLTDSIMSLVCVADGPSISSAYMMLDTGAPVTADKLFALSYLLEGTSAEIPGWHSATVWSLPLPGFPDLVLAKNEGTLLLGLGTAESLGQKLDIPDEYEPYLSQDNLAGVIVSSRILDVALNAIELANVVSGRNISGGEWQLYDAIADLRDSFDVILERVPRTENSEGKMVFKEDGDMVQAFLNLLSAGALLLSPASSENGVSDAMSDEDFVDLCVNGTPEEIERAIKDGANLNARGAYEATALMFAARDNVVPVVSLLLEAGANIGDIDEDGDTPLHWAAIGDNPAVILFLLDNGADAGALNFSGRKAIEWLSSTRPDGVDEAEWEEAVARLKEAGGDD